MTADLSHISTVATIDGFLPADDGMKKAFTGADMVIIPAGIPRKSTEAVNATGGLPALVVMTFGMPGPALVERKRRPRRE